MNRLLALILILSANAITTSAETISVPWDEFKALYKESVVRDTTEKLALPTRKKKPMVYTIEDSAYHLTIDKSHVRGKILLSGKTISGDLSPIHLFNNDIVISKIMHVTGGTLLSDRDRSKGIIFLPQENTNAFQIALSFLVAIHEDNTAQYISFATPHALRNSVAVELPPQTDLVEAPGIPDSTGLYHFAPASKLSIRFRHKNAATPAPIVDIDTFSSITVQGKRATITTSFKPIRPLPSSFSVLVQKETQYVATTLKSSWISHDSDGSYLIKIPQGVNKPFSIQFVADQTKEGTFSFLLPTIANNSGKEGDFKCHEPDNGQIRVSAQELVSALPATSLSPQLIGNTHPTRSYMHVPAGHAVTLHIKRFQAVSTPIIVLDSLNFFTTFEENGNILSVLSMEVPGEMGPRIKLKAVPDAEVWSLTVNGRKQKLYADSDGSWVIPLANGHTSKVQLALLHKGKKLGLYGRLEAILPQTGIPAKKVCVGISLPHRVQLLSIEGPVTPAPAQSWTDPIEGEGNPHFFQRAFYKGEGMTIAISYKEPADRE